MAHEAHNARIDSAQENFPLPDYRSLFRIAAWLDNTMFDWPWDLSEPPTAITQLDEALGKFVDLTLTKEGMTHDEMLRAIHAGEFDRD